MLLLAAFTAQSISAQENEPDNTFGGMEFFLVNHDIGETGRWFVADYFEHSNYQYCRLDAWYNRISLGYKIFPWLKTSVGYDIFRNPVCWSHRAVYDVTGSMKSGDLQVSVRERYIHAWSPAIDTQSNELRSLLKVQYNIPDSAFHPYLSAEVFTWGDRWKKTRHHVGCMYDLTQDVQMECSYLYFTFDGKPAEHVIGLGLNMDI